MKINKSILIKILNRKISNSALKNTALSGKSGLPYEIPIKQDENINAVNILLKDAFEYQKQENFAEILYDNMMRLKNAGKK